jgi:hypothetical protein
MVSPAAMAENSGHVEKAAGDAVVITLPVDGYEKVVRLVTAGHASRLGLGFESVDDLQLAIELVLRSLPARGGIATVRMANDAETLTVTVGPIGELTLGQMLRPMEGAGVALGASLEKLVDGVALSAGPDAAILLTKKLPPAAA